MGCHVLLMDPSSLARTAIQKALADSGAGPFTFTEAHDLEEARRRFDPETTDLALLSFLGHDSLAPAFRLVGTIRLRQTKPVCIILFGPERLRDNAELMMIDHYVGGPFSPRKIQTRVVHLLQSRRTAPTTASPNRAVRGPAPLGQR